MNNIEQTQETIETTDTSFAAFEAQSDELEVVEFDNAPLTDINFGF